MADFFEIDDVVKGYDSAIARRILSYLKPYKKLAVIGFLALAVSTAGELLSPAIIRQSIDRALMVSWYGFSPLTMREKANQALKITAKDPIVSGRVYLRSSRLSGLSGAERKDLEEKKYFSPKKCTF